MILFITNTTTTRPSAYCKTTALLAIIINIVIMTNTALATTDGWCSTISCSGRSESSCRNTFGCTTYENCNTWSGDHGMIDTITSTCGRS